MLTRTTQHALRAMVAIAQQEGERFVAANSISEMLDLPPSFLAKVLQRLTAAGLLVSLRGPKGGVRLAKSAQGISLRDVIEAIEGATPFDECLFGWPGCTNSEPCPIHREWGPALQSVSDLVDATSLADITRAASSTKGQDAALIADKRLVNP